MVLTTLSVAVREVSDTLKKSHKVARFQQRGLRRTVENMLQKLGIDTEVCAHLLSHGRTRGVQGQHYERHDFLDEKRRALRKWAAHLERVTEGKPLSTIAAIRAALKGPAPGTTIHNRAGCRDSAAAPRGADG